MASGTIFDKLFNKADRDHLIQQFALCGLPVNAEDPNTVLHWHIILHTNDAHSILLDMPPAGADGRTGILFIKSVVEPPTAEINIPSSVVGEVTVGAIVDLLITLKRDRYRYDDSGSGCRYWCEVVLEDMEKAGYVPGGASTGFKKQVETLSQTQPSRYPWPAREGTFYVSDLPFSIPMLTFHLDEAVKDYSSYVLGTIFGFDVRPGTSDLKRLESNGVVCGFVLIFVYYSLPGYTIYDMAYNEMDRPILAHPVVLTLLWSGPERLAPEFPVRVVPPQLSQPPLVTMSRFLRGALSHAPYLVQ